MASGPSILSFLRTISKMSGAGFDSSTSSEEVFRSTRSVMRAMSRYLSTSSFLAEDATAIWSPASRTRRSSSGTAEKGRTSGRYSVLKRLPRHSSSSLPWSRCSSADRKTGMSLSPPLAYLASSLFEAHIVAELEQSFLPCDRVEIHRVQKRAVQVEDSGSWQLKVLHGRSERVSRISQHKPCSSPCAG